MVGSPVISIGGPPSSGTTLLADLLDSVPGMAADPELGLFASAEPFAWTEEVRTACANNKEFPATSWYAAPRPFFNTKYLELVDLDAAALAAMIEASDSLPAFVDRLRRAREQARDRRIDVLVEKTPANVATASRFLDTFPDGVFVGLVRDPRATVASLIARGFGLAEATATWAQQSRRLAAVADHPRAMVVRYEDLVADPFLTTTEIADRVGIAVDPETVRGRFSENEFRAGIPRVESWRASRFDGRVMAAGRHELSTMSTGWIERQSLWLAHPSRTLEFVDSVAALASRFGYAGREVAKAKFTPERLKSVFRQFLEANAAFSPVHLITDAKFVVGFDADRPAVGDRDWARTLDAARPFIDLTTLHQLALQMELRRGRS